MEGFTNIDIFDTKGIEYIIIIFFLLMLIPFWILFVRQPRVLGKIKESLSLLTANILNIPQGLLFSKNHTWTFLEKSGVAKIGFDDFLLRLAGTVKIYFLKSKGDQILKGEALAIFVRDGKNLRIFSPITGEIIENNISAEKNPEIIQDDPYSAGWIYSVKPLDWKGDTSGFLLGEEATNWISREVERLKDFLAASFAKYSPAPSMVVFQEGGELKVNPLEDLQPEIWADFQKEFLDTI